MLLIDILTNYKIIYYSIVLVIPTIDITRRPCMTNHYYLVKYYCTTGKLCLPVHCNTTVQTCEAHTIFMTTKSLTTHSKLCLPVHRNTTVQTCEAHTIFMTTKSLTPHKMFKSPLPPISPLFPPSPLIH